MLKRTTCITDISYIYYGAREIKVCDEWQNFENFMRDMYPSYLEHCEKYGEGNTSIERIDNDKGYNKENCKWATCAEQSSNRRHVKKYEINGEMLTVPEIAQRYNLEYSTVHYRIKNNWPLHKVIEPTKKEGK
jgi:hypothetical protein